MPYKSYDFYRRKTTRLQKWEYSWSGYYFITIKTKDNIHYFGQVENEKMILSDIGKIAYEEWMNTPDIRPDMNISFGEFVIMPNHIHAIIKIGKNPYNCIDAMHRVGTIYSPNKNIFENGTQHIFGPQKKNLSSIVRGYKSKVTLRSRQINSSFEWKSRFNDQIIFDKEHLKNCETYIRNNPNNWKTKANKK